MIIVNVYGHDKDINKVEVSGHSGYDVSGKDIVCASVSTAFIMSANLLEKLNLKFEIKSNEEIPYMSLSIDENSLSKTIMVNLIDSLKGIELQYSNYIKIKFI